MVLSSTGVHVDSCRLCTSGTARTYGRTGTHDRAGDGANHIAQSGTETSSYRGPPAYIAGRGASAAIGGDSRSTDGQRGKSYDPDGASGQWQLQSILDR